MISHKLKSAGVALALASSMSMASETKHIFVDPVNGSVKGTPKLDGSITKPFKYINDAIGFAETRFNRGDVRYPYTIQLRGGRYTQVVTRSGVRGAADRPITIQPYNNESVLFDGSIDVSSGWQSEGGNIYSKHIGEDVWQLFLKEGQQWQEKVNARWPNARFGEATTDVASVYTRDSWAHANTSGNANGTMVDDTLSDDPIVNDVDLTGALVVANIASFDTWTREITSHAIGANTFTYAKTPRIWKNQKHFYYYVEGKKELLDNDNEWFFDKDTQTAYLYSSSGAPTGEIRAKKQPYAFNVGGWEHVTLKNVNFFAETLRCGNCENFTFENANLEFGGSSRRALGQTGQKSEILFVASNNRDLSHRSNHVLRNIKVTNVDGQGFFLRGNGNVVENSHFENIDWAATETYAPSSSLVFDGNFSEFRYNTVKTAGTSETLATMGAKPQGSGKYTGPIGGMITAEFNDISNTGFAQSDGALIQLRIPAQKGSIIRYNWLHDSTKYGIRFDAPIPATLYGSEVLAHNNVIWNANGMMVKGEDHRVYHNTVFDTKDAKRSDLIILDDADVGGVLGGANRGTVVINNAADVISSQRASIEPMLSWVTFGHNFNGDRTNQLVSKYLKDPSNHDFRPNSNGQLRKGDGITDPELTSQQGGVLSYTGSYRSGMNQYWYPGRREVKATGAIPKVDSSDVQISADLIWRPAYQATSYNVYIGKDKNRLNQVSSLTNNIFDPGVLHPNQTYYWRVDAVTEDGIITGDSWQFTTGMSASH
jgi:hypothetical protein